jgi:hypothetical protein
VSIIEARLDAAEEFADTRTLKVLPEGQISGAQGLLDMRRFLVPLGAVAAADRAIAERNLAWIRVIEAKI